MPATLEQLQTEQQNNEDLRLIESRLDNLSEMLEPQPESFVECEPADRFTLGNYRLEIAKVIDQAMAETKTWWTPDRA
jgi:hypothetical protein